MYGSFCHMYFYQVLILESYYYYRDYKMLRLQESNSRNLEVCTLKVREDGVRAMQNIGPIGDFRDDLQLSFCSEETKTQAF